MKHDRVKKNESKAARTIDITVSPEELRRFEDAAFRSIAKDLDVPGFRKGQAPESVARTHIAPERIFSEAVERAIAEKTSAALAALTEEVVGEPRIEVRKVAPGNPLEFRITVEVLPAVALDDWRNLRIARRQTFVSDDDVARTLEELRRSRARYRDVLRPAAKGDLVEVDFTARIDGVVIEGGTAERYPVPIGEESYLLPGFAEALIGMAEGEEKTFRLTFPKDWRHKAYQGKEAEFAVKVRSVKERLLPDLDDAFAQLLGTFATLEELKTSIREGLQQEQIERESRRIRVEAVERLAARIPDEALPEVLVTQEIGLMEEELRSSVERHGLAYADYLAHLRRSEEAVRDGLREGALRRVKGALVLRALARREGIEVTEAELNERMQETLRRFRDAGEAERRIDPEELRSYTENVLRNEKTLELIEHVVTDRRTMQNSTPVEPTPNHAEPSA